MSDPAEPAREQRPAKLQVPFVARLGEFAIYGALAGFGTLVILWLLANT